MNRMFGFLACACAGAATAAIDTAARTATRPLVNELRFAWYMVRLLSIQGIWLKDVLRNVDVCRLQAISCRGLVLFRLFHGRRLPSAVDDGRRFFLWPVQPHHQNKFSIWSW